MFERGVSKPIIFDPNNPLYASKTHQSFAKDADINNIMSRYAKTGVLVDPLKVDLGRQPHFGDFSDIADFNTLVNRVQQAQDDFMTLPALVRRRFNNNVQECIEFIADPANLKEAVAMKLLPDSMLPKEPEVVPPAQAPAV